MIRAARRCFLTKTLRSAKTYVRISTVSEGAAAPAFCRGGGKMIHSEADEA